MDEKLKSEVLGLLEGIEHDLSVGRLDLAQDKVTVVKNKITQDYEPLPGTGSNGHV